MTTLRTRTTRTLPTDTTRIRPTFVDRDRDETDALEEARRGNPAAWEYLYHHFGPALTRYAASRGIPDPEDVTQEVMYAAATTIHDFAGDWDNLRSWLFTIAYRRCADYHRRRHRRPEHLTDRPPENLAPQDGADADLWTDGEAREALAALDILADREREIVTLRIIGELTTQEVADTLGTSRGNVRVVQSRALARMRHYLEGNGGFLDKRFRSAAAPTAITLTKMGLLRRLRYMGETLPSDGPLGAWAETLRSAPLRSSRGVTDIATAAAQASAALGMTSTATDPAATSGLGQTITAVIAAGAVAGGVLVTPAHTGTTPAPPATTVGQNVASPAQVEQRRTMHQDGAAPDEGRRVGEAPTRPEEERHLLVPPSVSTHPGSPLEPIVAADNLGSTDVDETHALSRITDEVTDRTDDVALTDPDEAVDPGVALVDDQEIVPMDPLSSQASVDVEDPEALTESVSNPGGDTVDGIDEVETGITPGS